MEQVARLLRAEQRFERDFAREAASWPAPSTGWPTALVFFHIYRWRERMGDGLRQLRDGQPVTPPPENFDELNDRELPQGAGISLRVAADRASAVLAEVIELWNSVGDRPMQWYIAQTSGEAVIRNSYFHPRNHIGEHLVERGDAERGIQIFAETISELRAIDFPKHTVGPAIYNLACMRVRNGQLEEALPLLAEALPMRSDLPSAAATDPDLAPLRDDRRFQALITT